MSDAIGSGADCGFGKAINSGASPTGIVAVTVRAVVRVIQLEIKKWRDMEISLS